MFPCRATRAMEGIGMSIGRGMLTGAAMGALAAALWAGASYMTGMRLGFLDIGVGAATGLGMAAGMKNRGGVVPGLVAALIAVVAIMGSRFSVINLHVRDMASAVEPYTADDAVEEFAMEAAMRDPQAWEGPDESHYRAAREQWGAMSQGEQASHVASRQAEHAQFEGAMTLGASIIGTIIDFGLFGFVWVGLGAAGAWRLGSRREVESTVEESPANFHPGIPAGAPAAAARPAGVEPGSPAAVTSGPAISVRAPGMPRHVPASLKVAGYSREGPTESGGSTGNREAA
jgi:hypothetical protein